MVYTTSNFEEVVLITISICGQIDRRQFMEDLEKEPYCYKRATIKSKISLMEKDGLIKTYTPREEVDDRKILERNKTKLLRLSYPKGDEKIKDIFPMLYTQFEKMGGEKRFGEAKHTRKRREELSRLAYANLTNKIPVDFNEINYLKSNFENLSSVEYRNAPEDFKEAFEQMEDGEVNYFTKPSFRKLSLIPIGTTKNVGSSFLGVLVKKPSIYVCYYQTTMSKRWNSVEKTTKYALFRKTHAEGAEMNIPRAILYVENMAVFDSVICEPPKETAKTGELSRYYDEGVYVVPMEHQKKIIDIILADNEEEVIRRAYPNISAEEYESMLACDLVKMKNTKKTKKKIACFDWQLPTMRRYYRKGIDEFLVVPS